MLQKIVLLILFLTLIIIGGCKNEIKINKPANIEQFFKEVSIRDKKLDNNYKEQLRNWGRKVKKPDNKTIIKYYEQYKTQKSKLLKKELEVLHSYNFANLTKQQRIYAKTVEWGLKVEQEEIQYYDYYPKIHSASLRLISALRDFDINTKADIKKYFAKINELKGRFYLDRALIAKKKTQNIISSQRIVQNTIKQCRKLIFISDVTKTEAYTRFAGQIENLNLTKKRAKQLLAKLENKLKTEICPLYQSYIGYLNQLPKSASIEAGVCELPRGQEFYKFLLRRYTTTNLTPEQAFALAKKEVSKQKKQLVTALTEAGYKNPIKNDLYFYNLKGEQIYFPYQVMDKYKVLLAETRERLPELFNQLPRTEVKVRKNKMQSSPAYYNQEKNSFYINPNNTPQSVYRIKHLIYHEALPGHHFQLSIEAERNNKLDYQQDLYLGGYSEGWACYAEQLAYEYQFYNTSIQKIKYLQGRLRVMMQTVVDIGINYKGWSLSEAHQYVKKTIGRLPKSNSYGRALFAPGQWTTYGIGLLKVEHLRTKAKQKLGAKFDIKEFHDVLLRNGKIPLAVLKKEVNNYIRQK